MSATLDGLQPLDAPAFHVLPITGPALRYHGAKFRLAPWLQQFFPPHRCYTEAFGGAAGVLLKKPRCYAEVYNDLDGSIVNFFRVLRDPQMRARLIEALRWTPYARDEFVLAQKPVTDDPVERARCVAIRAAMGFGSAGATKDQTGFRTDTTRAYSTAQHVWARYPDSLVAIGQRLQGVLIENRPAAEVLRQHDAADTLHYVDPPYLLATRVLNPGRRYYAHELADHEHVELLAILRSLQGMVVLSGYPSTLYDELLPGWQRHTTKSRISAGRGTITRDEVVWINPKCAQGLSMADGLFACPAIAPADGCETRLAEHPQATATAKDIDARMFSRLDQLKEGATQ